MNDVLFDFINSFERLIKHLPVHSVRSTFPLEWPPSCSCDSLRPDIPFLVPSKVRDLTARRNALKRKIRIIMVNPEEKELKPV